LGRGKSGPILSAKSARVGLEWFLMRRGSSAPQVSLSHTKKTLIRCVAVSVKGWRYDSSESHRESKAVTQARRGPERETPVALLSLRVRGSGPVSEKGSTEDAKTVRRPALRFFGSKRQPARSAQRLHAVKRVARARPSSLRGREAPSRWFGWLQGAWKRRHVSPSGSSEPDDGASSSERAPRSLELGDRGEMSFFGGADRRHRPTLDELQTGCDVSAELSRWPFGVAG
jgi:hypothetical protein